MILFPAIYLNFYELFTNNRKVDTLRRHKQRKGATYISGEKKGGNTCSTIPSLLLLSSSIKIETDLWNVNKITSI